MSRTRRVVSGLTCVLLIATSLAGCTSLTPTQDAGWLAFHQCQAQAASASLEDLSTSGRINYRTQEGYEFSVMKSCLEARGYSCDLGVTIGSRPQTHCYPKAS